MYVAAFIKLAGRAKREIVSAQGVIDQNVFLEELDYFGTQCNERSWNLILQNVSRRSW